MSINDSRKGFSEPIFFILFIVSPMVSVGIVVLAFLSNSLLAIVFALPFGVVMPIWCYIDGRVKQGLVRGGGKTCGGFNNQFHYGVLNDFFWIVLDAPVLTG